MARNFSNDKRDMSAIKKKYISPQTDNIPCVLDSHLLKSSKDAYREGGDPTIIPSDPDPAKPFWHHSSLWDDDDGTTATNKYDGIVDPWQ